MGHDIEQVARFVAVSRYSYLPGSEQLGFIKSIYLPAFACLGIGRETRSASGTRVIIKTRKTIRSTLSAIVICIWVPARSAITYTDSIYEVIVRFLEARAQGVRLAGRITNTQAE